MPRRRQRKRNRARRSSQNAVEIQVTDNETVITATTTPSFTSISGSSLSVTTHAPRLYLPCPDFLNVLKTVGAKGQPSSLGEAFNLSSLATYLKKYIWVKHLYDDDEPSVVYCDKDPLGKVFGVNSFTVRDANTLLLQVCIPLDARYSRVFNSLHRKEQVTTPIKHVPANTTVSKQPEIQVDQVVSSTGNDEGPFQQIPQKVCLPHSKVETSEVNEDISKKDASSGHDTDDGDIRTPNGFPIVVGSPRPNDSGVGTDMGDPSFTRETEGTPNPGESPVPSSSACSSAGAACDMLDPGEGSSSRMDVSDSQPPPRGGRGVKRKRHWTDSGILRTRGSSDQEDSHSGGRQRGSSFSLVFDEGTQIQWEWLIPVFPSSDDSEILSVQSKETAYARDTTDDNWISEEEVNAISIEIAPRSSSIDPPFPEEYEVESDSQDGPDQLVQSGGDSDSTEILEEICVLCPESDMEWWADSESSDSDSDISGKFDIPDEDKWECPDCENKNTPLRRLCDRCMNVRPNWLPRALPEERCRVPAIASSGEEEYNCPPPAPVSEEIPSHTLRVASDPTPLRDPPSPENFGLSRKALSDSFQQDVLADRENSPLCKICFSKPKDAAIIHGKTGHQMCCYECAKKLRRGGKPCPVCRRKIQRVVKNYLM